MNNYLRFCIYILLTIIINFSTKYILNIDSLIYNSLSDKLTNDQIKNIITLQEKWNWITYFFIPLFFLLKTSIIASVVYIGTFFNSKVEVTFKKLWAIVIKAEFIFLLVPVIKIIWFYFFQTNYTLEDIQYFYPLSALNIIGYKGLETWYIYPFQVINLFELAYWLLLSYFIGKATETNTDRGLKIVSYSYGPALLLWIVIIMFVTLNFS